MYNKYLLIPIANLIYKFSTFQYIISQFYGQNIGISYRQYYKMCIGNKNFTFFMGILVDTANIPIADTIISATLLSFSLAL